MAFPPAHMLVGAGIAEVVRVYEPLPRWRAWVAAAALAALPDADIMLGLALGQGGADHGTFTHSIVAVVVVGLVAWAVAGRRWGVLAAAAYASHLVVDLLDDRGRTNVLLGWPFTETRPYAIARFFPTVPFEQGHGAMAAARSLLEPEVFSRLLQQTALGALCFVLLLLVAAALRAGRLSRPRAATPPSR
jgi:membrane-bound metal-dependent hydrolase YbcI (DUF457 family)